jgi:hypothetical protein
MPNEKLRRQIAWDAAQMIRAGQESEYYTARMKAARRAVRGWVPEEDLPGDDEIRNLVQSLTSPPGGDRFDHYRRLLMALEQVKLNSQYHPEGDALNHTLQVFDLARCDEAQEIRPRRQLHRRPADPSNQVAIC